MKLSGRFSQLESSKVLVAGDLIMDSYTIGDVKRISPEAPVPILNVKRERMSPGGAGNVVLSLMAMGMEVSILGRIGNDSVGEEMKKKFADYNANISGILVDALYKTPIKNRIIAGDHQIVRVDYEDIKPLSKNVENIVMDHIPSLLEGVKIVAVSDYAKGFLTSKLLRMLIDSAKKREIPVIVDPKGTDFSIYRGAKVLKPNISEAFAAAKLPPTATLEEVAAKLFQEADSDVIIITKSEDGIAVFQRDRVGYSDFPVNVREVNDVTGAGDTVLATLSCALASGLSVSESVQLSNFAAGIAVEHIGCCHVTLSQIARRLLESDVSNKIFGEEDLFALQQVIKGRRYNIFSLCANGNFHPDIFESIRFLSGKKDVDLILYIKDPHPEEKRVGLLASLREVSVIILKSEGFEKICKMINPEGIYHINNGHLEDVPYLEKSFQS